jgi:BirA family biotin operon repressor/biotin-[acetyl-CoA-carboxylase] ligase
VAKDIPTSAISGGLKTRFIGQRIIYYPSLPSTMDAARREASRGTHEGTVIVAGEQTGGRGRLQHKWLSPEGNIAVSIILYPDITNLPYLMMIAALAVVHSIEAVTGQKTQIKWPNDILIDGKKVGGILIENEMKGNKAAYSVIGIGVNVSLQVADYAEIANTATSLTTESDKNDLRAAVISSLLTEFERSYLKLPNGESIFKDWRDRLVTLGEKVRAISGSQTIEGVAEAVDESGALILRRPDGTLARVVAGDVTLREK